MDNAAIHRLTDADTLARAIGSAMFAQDAASQGLGMQLKKISPGYACVTMTVRHGMLNSHQTCHGGFIFTLADSAFAYACNSGNQNTVASGCTIDYLAPAREGDHLQAEAVEQSRAGRLGVYDVTVSNQEGLRIALFRGKSYQIKGEVIGGLESRTRGDPA